jgi:hypothetical protein
MEFWFVRVVAKYKVVQIWPGRFVCKQVTVCPGHIWTTLYLSCSKFSNDLLPVFMFLFRPAFWPRDMTVYLVFSAFTSFVVTCLKQELKHVLGAQDRPTFSEEPVSETNWMAELLDRETEGSESCDFRLSLSFKWNSRSSGLLRGVR